MRRVGNELLYFSRQESSVTTASAKNLGDISSKDVDKVIRQGKRTRQFIRSHDDDSSSTDPVSVS
jgi:hypothetical protein